MELVLETPRLALRELSPADLDFVAGMLGHPEVMRHYPRQLSRDEAAQWIGRQVQRYRRDGHGLWLVVEKAGCRPVGQVGLLHQRVEGRAEAEVGYLLDRPFWGQGFATEAAAAVRDDAFALGHAYVISLIRPANLPSRAVAQRLGMSAGRTVRHAGLEHLVFEVRRPARGAALPGAAGVL